MMRIPSWNLVREAKAWLRAHVQIFSLKFSQKLQFLQYTIFEIIFREMLVKHSPDFLRRQDINSYGTDCVE